MHVDGYRLLNTKVPDRRGRPSFDRPLFTYLQPEVYTDSSTIGPLTVRNSGTRSSAELRDEIRRSSSAFEVSKIFLCRPLSHRRSPNSLPEICPPKIRRKNYGAPNFASRKSVLNTSRRRIFLASLSLYTITPYLFLCMFSAYKLLLFGLFSEGLMCMRQNLKLLLCCLYFEFDCLNVSVLLAEFVVFGRIFSRIP